MRGALDLQCVLPRNVSRERGSSRSTAACVKLQSEIFSLCENGLRSVVQLDGISSFRPIVAENAAADAAEIESNRIRLENEAKIAAEEAARESARTKLAALGLTEAEVAALVK